MVDSALCGVFPPMPQVGLGHFVQRSMPVRPQSSPANRRSCRAVSAYCDWVVTVKLVEYVERLVFSGSPRWVVPAAATPKPTPVTGLEETNGITVRWRLAGFLSESPGGGGFLSPSSSPSQVGKSSVAAAARRSDGRATSFRPAATEPLPAGTVAVEPGSATSGTSASSSVLAGCAPSSSAALAGAPTSSTVTSQPARAMPLPRRNSGTPYSTWRVTYGVPESPTTWRVTYGVPEFLAVLRAAR